MSKQITADDVRDKVKIEVSSYFGDACRDLVDACRDLVVDDVLKIVNEGKKYPPRGDTEELRIPEDQSTGIARKYFNINAYK